MPSPMALNPPSPTPSIFSKKKHSSPSLKSAASYLSALSQADAMQRARGNTPISTPALSLASSRTTSSEDTILNEDFNDEDGLSVPKVPPTSEQVFHTLHSEFGHCTNEEYRHVSQHVPGKSVATLEEEPPYYILLSTYFSYIVMILFGHLSDFIGKRFNPRSYQHLRPHNGYAPLNSDFDSFYTRTIKRRLDDCFSMPVTGVPGRTITVLDRDTADYNRTFNYSGTRTRALNVSSYNYLGFAQARGGCADAVEESIKRYGVSSCGSRLEGGTLDLHVQGEAMVAQFIGHEDALLSSMGYATNSTIIPALVNNGCLVISDELNHASIRVGVRLSGASVRMFKHNDMKVLEDLLREVISQGQPRTHRPWKKILVIVEGLFSMEGTLPDLPKILELKKKYKFYLFVDEAHSVGALGPNGRGITDYFNIDPRSIDILMGTFTKSFGAAGGYIAGSRTIIDRLRIRGHGGTYAESMSPAVITQIMASMASITGVAAPLITHSSPLLHLSSSTSTIGLPEIPSHPSPTSASLLPSWLFLSPSVRDGSEGRTRLRRLAFNARYLSRGLVKLGFITYGHSDSPVVPLLIYNPAKMAVFSRLMRERKTPIVVVAVGYPATNLITARVRFCVSASHTKEDIDTVLRACDEIGTLLDLKHHAGERWTIDQVIERAVELVRMD